MRALISDLLVKEMAVGSDKCGDSEHASDSSTSSETSQSSSFSSEASNEYSNGGRNGNILKIGGILPTHVTRLKRKSARRIRLQNAG